MERKSDLGSPQAVGDTSSQPERGAREVLSGAADQVDARPWRHASAPPSAVDLTQYALWRSSELTLEELLAALSLLRPARSEVENVEIGLIFAARQEGLTWAQLAQALGFRSPQACQQYVNRLSARHSQEP